MGYSGYPYVTPPETLECCHVLPSCTSCHTKPDPVLTKDASAPSYHAITLQDLQAYVPVQGLVCIFQFQKYCALDLFPRGRYLLKKFGLKGSGTRAVTHLKTMEDFVEGNGGCEAAIENFRHYLPHHLH